MSVLMDNPWGMREEVSVRRNLERSGYALFLTRQVLLQDSYGPRPPSLISPRIVHEYRHVPPSPADGRCGAGWVSGACSRSMGNGRRGAGPPPVPRNSQAKPTIVLVHGGYADSSCWNGAIQKLQHQGYTTIAGSNPLRGVATDAPYIASLLDSISGPIVLVAHSMGGTVITNAAAGKTNVKALVYIAAFVPDVDESQGEHRQVPGQRDPGRERSCPLHRTRTAPREQSCTSARLAKRPSPPTSPPPPSNSCKPPSGPSTWTPSPSPPRPRRGEPSRPGAWSPAATRQSRPSCSASCTAVRTPAKSSKCPPRPTLR